MIGKRFTRWTVTAETSLRHAGGSKLWNCVCDCGNTKNVATKHLNAGKSKSCGCLNAEKQRAKKVVTTKVEIREYRIWAGMKTRCENEKAHTFKDYGERGITVSEGWSRSFENFLKDMGKCPEGFTLERKNNDLGYSKENCTWASVKMQARNRRSNVMVTYKGETRCLVEWVEILGLNYSKVNQRLKRLGWTAEKAFEA